MTVWFTADPHWGHRLVANLRGFDDTDAHDRWLFDLYADTFRPGDLVWWLGDLTVRMKPADASSKCRYTQPEATHRLIYGNHDAAHPMHSKAHRYHADYRGFFRTAEAFGRRKVPGVGDVLLSHFSYSGDHGEDRFVQWRLPDLGVPIIHGHTHGPEKVTRSPAGTLQLHVGIDAWRRPVSEQEIVALLRTKVGEQS